MRHLTGDSSVTRSTSTVRQ